ncbi:hypothetical protein Bca52824_076670 [Brassica carinata]|uniref:Uncharacterized protein n=1 Tax=Brassica carinata TaxID=52824 RepID=A0A8X7TZA6_BRACI|nr:hypothetical protein Bca52824_076670 [Brassica carinata]
MDFDGMIDYGRVKGRKTKEKAKEDKENSESGEEKDVVSWGKQKDGEKENNEKGEEEKDQEPEKTKKTRILMKLRIHGGIGWRKFSVKASERVRVQAIAELAEKEVEVLPKSKKLFDRDC